MELKDIKTENKERDLDICRSYTKGERAIDIASRHNISLTRTYQILSANKECVKIDKEYEKLKRILALKRRLEEYAEKPLTNKDEIDILKELRREIEGDRPIVDQSTHYTKIEYCWEDEDEQDEIENSLPASRIPERNT